MDPNKFPVEPQLRSTYPAETLDSFFRIAEMAQTDHLDRNHIALEARPLFVEEWPKERLAQAGKPFDFIGFHVVRSQRATNSNNGYVPFKGLRLVESEPSPENAGYLAENYMWEEDGVLQFTVFSQSNQRATDVARWLLSLILFYNHNKFFAAYGFRNLVFQGRLEDTIEKTQDQDLYTRRIQFRVTSQNIFNLEAKTLETFTLNVGLNGGSSPLSITMQDPS